MRSNCGQFKICLGVEICLRVGQPRGRETFGRRSRSDRPASFSVTLYFASSFAAESGQEDAFWFGGTISGLGGAHFGVAGRSRYLGGSRHTEIGAEIILPFKLKFSLIEFSYSCKKRCEAERFHVFVFTFSFSRVTFFASLAVVRPACLFWWYLCSSRARSTRSRRRRFATEVHVRFSAIPG